MDQVLLTFFILIVVVHIALVLWLYWGVNAKRSAVHYASSVSVIIAARNEDKHLPNLLERLKTQQHPDFEVILIDDRSSDDTPNLLAQFKDTPWLKTIRVDELPENWNGKKYALKQGIQRATKDVLLFTDADCLPKSDLWISRMTEKIGQKTEVVLGFGGYSSSTGLMNRLIQFDTAFTAIQYLGFAAHKLPYMAVGRNWAVKKKSYPIGLLETIAALPGGDDDLIAQAICIKENTLVSLSPESRVESYPEKDSSSYIKQKIRHLAIGANYSFKAQTISSILPLLQGSSLALFLATIITGQGQAAILIFGIQSLSFYVIFRRLGQKLETTLSHWSFPWVQQCYPLWLAFIGIRSLAAKQIEWKAENSFLKKH